MRLKCNVNLIIKKKGHKNLEFMYVYLIDAKIDFIIS